ncbi:MAG: FAD-dependent oxidoreductase [Fimbriimonadaceae bacterium]|nr:FAD-dependent oxidoreductase [Fimbriimonadaceae bacterium]
MKHGLVIIGGVAAGPKMAAKARREDPDVPITLVTDEAVISYAGCGTPYYLGRTFDQREKLLVRRPEDFGAQNKVTMLTGHRATQIDPAARTVTVVELASGTVKVLPYDQLGLATGARPFVPPLPGLPAEGVFTLRSVTDAFAIDDYIDLHHAHRVVVVGGGYIGLEVAEQFRERGLEVTLVELMDQVMPRFDVPLAHAVKAELERLGVEVLVDTKVEAIDVDHRNRVTGVKTSRGPVSADLVILSIGVRANSELAREAGLAIGPTGAIAVNERQQTSDPRIFAAGDCAEQRHLVDGQPCWIPLGSTANKQGRVAAVNMTGGHETFPGVVGTSLVRIGQLNAGGTGLLESQLVRAGHDYETVIVPQADRPGYMPGVGEVTLILHADRATRRVLGAQAFGPGVVDKRIDILAVAVTAQMTVDQVANLDLGYAPPFSPALDVVITAANVMRNKLDAKTASVTPHKLLAEPADPQRVLLDCREVTEWNGGRLPGARLMPLGSLSERCGDLDPSCAVVVYCKGGLRSAEGYRKLRRAGLKKVRYLDGGITAWCGDVEH